MSEQKLREAISNGDTLQVALLLHNTSESEYVMGKILLHACKEGFEDISILLDNGADVNFSSREPWHMTPLMCACRGGYTSIIGVLLDHGADTDTQKEDGLSALHYAADRDCLDIVKLLVAKGASIEIRDSTGYTPLHNACVAGCINVAKFLLDEGADPDVLTVYGETASHLADRGLFPAMTKLFDH